MKKVSLLVLLAILASTLLMAAIPTTIVRLTIINKSEFDVYMKLEGSGVTTQFYYLTVPSGTRDEPTVKVFTIMSDLYKRTTWQCNGVKSSGTLLVSSNIRLTFTPCGEMVCVGLPGIHLWETACGKQYWVVTSHRKAGEPTMEKVTYFKWLQAGSPYWSIAYLYGGYWNTACATWFYRIRTYRIPFGCAWLYQY
jgi:hypothetical protein